MGLKIITQPTEEPLTIEQCRAHLNVQPYDVDSDGGGTHPDDALIMAMQSAAREYCENFTGLSLAIKTYELALDAFPSAEIELPRPPVTEIVSVISADTEGALHLLDEAGYVLDAYQRPGWLLPASGTSWPATGTFVNAVKIQYRAGFGDDSDSEPLPFVARAAMLLILGHLYAHREEATVATEKALQSIPTGAEALLRPLRINMGMA